MGREINEREKQMQANDYGQASTQTSKEASIETRMAIHKSLWALRARNLQKISKQVSPGLRAWSVQNLSKRVKKSQESLGEVSFGHFLKLFDSLRDFLDTPGPEARGDLFWYFLEISGPEGPETPVNGRSGLKASKLWSFLYLANFC